MTEADVDDPLPLLTLLDLWHTAHGERTVYFQWEGLEDLVYGDWLMQNMALVVNRILRQPSRTLSEPPYCVNAVYYFSTHSVAVKVFMENKDGNC